MIRAWIEDSRQRGRLESAGVSSAGPAQVEQDSRGILDPWLLRQRVKLTRYPAGQGLEDLVEWFWAVRWDLPPGAVHRQQVLTHPGANISVGTANARPGDRRAGPVEARLNGVARGLTTRVLVRRGWAVAAITWPGGLGAFVAGSAADFTGNVVPLGQAVGLHEAELLREITGEPTEAERVKLLAAALEQAVDPARAAAASQVAAIAKIAEADRSVRRLADLCRAAGAGQRTLQRMFLSFAGVSPSWVIRRYRLLDAAEAVRDGHRISWAEMAAALGYADQSHLIRDFRAAIGQTPAAYAQAQADLRSQRFWR